MPALYTAPLLEEHIWLASEQCVLLSDCSLRYLLNSSQKPMPTLYRLIFATVGHPYLAAKRKTPFQTFDFVAAKHLLG